jgi:peptidoglycan/xylan/chitin deacetylase (PgdA/CDA1 family)
MRLYRPCFLAVRFFSEALFREKTDEKVLYLTFDDGPDLLSTLSILKILAKHTVRAVFFCSGKAASENPDLVLKIRSEVHIVGNHGYNHLDGLFSSKRKYLDDIKEASLFTSDSILRPPYGRLRIGQYRELKKFYRIIMWDVMPFDFDRKLGSNRSLSILKKLVRPGSVIVLHDTPGSTVHKFLEAFIQFAIGEGYRFDIP